jgi:hypothetical protein
MELTEKFHPSLVKKNQSGQDYVSIDGYINRLNTVLGHKWAWGVNSWKLKTDVPTTSSGKPQYLAIVQGTLTVVLDDIGVISIGEDDDSFLTTQRGIISRDGIGAGINFDPDTAVKTAQAEALKKACHQFGIALYLWDEEERDFVALQRKAMKSDAGLKELVVTVLERNGQDATKENMMTFFDIKDVTPANLRGALEGMGLL